MNNPYLNSNNESSNVLIDTLDYLGINLERFNQMSDNQIRQLVKKFSDVLNDGKISTSKSGFDVDDKPKHAMFVSGEYEGRIAPTQGYMDSGSFSRYFSLDNWWQERIKKLPDEVKKVFPFLIVPKASPNEKQEGLSKFEKKQWVDNSKEDKPQNRSAAYRSNFHPTVKPLDLMSYLVTLGSRNNDLVLDPFIGSGTTAIACRILNRKFIGFELSKEYHQIAEARLKEYIIQKKLFEILEA